jgi:acyl carrier protein
MTERIIEIIREEASMTLSPDAVINEDTDLISDLHIDSIDMVMIIGDIENEYGITIDNAQITGIRTVRQIQAKIKELQGTAE